MAEWISDATTPEELRTEIIDWLGKAAQSADRSGDWQKTVRAARHEKSRAETFREVAQFLGEIKFRQD